MERRAQCYFSLTLRHKFKRALGPFLVWFWPVSRVPGKFWRVACAPEGGNCLWLWNFYCCLICSWQPAYKDRARLDLQSGTLHIHNVQKEDSSTYLLMVLKDPGYEDEWKISLVVLDPVPKPVIEVKKTQEVNKCHLTLSCVIQDQPVNYTWYAESLPKESRSSVLEVTHTPQNYSSSYTCQVSNPVSSQNNTVNFTSPCVLATSSGVAWTATWLVIMVTTVLGLLWI
ncbi:CD48 antigen isoform X3 [Delphinapterus leucas]|uniref:CD48 antigen isoform X3 n=1 Tax=Delphinapterus leucas TaxID=9749 RepID=A0A2Y9LZS3_DELLE|nr:CD48 antigen isoform X3 [Delphinapterus leucas]